MAALACAPFGLGAARPTVTPTPPGDTISFLIPAYAYNLQPGDTVPGTRLRYIGRQDSAYEVTINDLTALKRGGDSFIWSGIVAPGVYADYNLRITTAVFGGLPVAGPVEITVFNPDPVALATTDPIEAPLYYNNIVVTYQIPVGREVPGTMLVYQGVVEQGEGDQRSQLAELAGIEGYPYLALGDSLLWTGKLRENVTVRFNLRVLSISENNLRVGGTAELWVSN